MIKLTIVIEDYTLKELKRIYRIYFGRPDTEKVTKSDIENWVGGMAQADIEAADSTNN